MPEELQVTATMKPSSLDEACAQVRDLAAERTAIFPAGGGTALDYGYPASRPGTILDTTDLDRIDDYPSEDMTITVQAGIGWAALADVLRKQNQMLPVDVANAPRATLGGALATNASGPRRYGYGTLRDYVIGIDVIDAAGRRVHAGGRVVKNVAGYDLMKLHLGALGTLGVIVQVSLKLRPLPAARCALIADVTLDNLEAVLGRLVGSKTRPVAIDVHNALPETVERLEMPPSAVAPSLSNYRLILLFEEHPAAVAWQADAVRSELGAFVTHWQQIEDPAAYDCLLHWLTHWPTHQSNVLFKANVLPGKVTEFLRAASDRTAGLRLAAQAGNGIVWGAFDAPDVDSAAKLLALASDSAQNAGGNLIVPRAPCGWKPRLPIWGQSRPDWQLMRQLKTRLDPYDIFNPGRFVFSGPP
jgi:glycolate oxidase FAD binding subunit